MKIQYNSNAHRHAQGSILVISLAVAAIIAIGLASYLSLTANQFKSVTRAQAWNAAMPVAEAGVEEALTQLCCAGTNKLWQDGWTLGADGMYRKTRTLPGDRGYYGVAIQPLTNPVIWSTGYVALPWLGSGSNVYVGRLVRVVTTNVLSLGGGINAKGNITLGGGDYVDAYTITNGAYATNSPTDKAEVLTDSTNSGAIKLGGGSSIKGTVVTGPGTGTVTTGGTSVVGSTSFVNSGGSGASPNVESGYFRTDANVQINDITLPTFPSSFTAFTPTTKGNSVAGVSGTTSFYQVSSINLGSSNTLYINGNVTIYCSQGGSGNSVKLTSQAAIVITPGSQLTLYLNGNFDNTGSGVINETGLADNVMIYGLPGCTSFNYNGSSDFIGVVYAPEADFKFTGSSREVGGFVVKTASFSGSGGVHVDRHVVMASSYVASSWNEMPLH